MPVPRLLGNEAMRLSTLQNLGVLDTSPEAEFDLLVHAASRACGVPISLISLLDEHRQWFKAKIGLEGISQTPREHAFCVHAIESEDVFEIEDATLDSRFAENPLVLGEPGIRFYAGAPVRLADGSALGTLCVIDRRPRRLDEAQRDVLRALAAIAVQRFESCRVAQIQRRVAHLQAERETRLRRLYEGTLKMLSSIDNEVLLSGVLERDADGGVRRMRRVGRAMEQATEAAEASAGSLVLDATGAGRVPPPGLATELVEQHALLRVTLQSIGDGVITTDAHGFVCWLNPVAERLTGWLTIDACGEPVSRVFNIVSERTGERVENQLAKCLEQGKIVRLSDDTILMSRDGRSYGIEDSAAPIRNDQGVIFGAVLVFRDVTEQRQIEASRTEREQELRTVNAELERLARHLAKARDAANRASRAKSRFLAGMSHELRTPLNGILGYAQLLRMEGGLTPAQAARVDAMLGAGAHLLEMITSVLDLSEIEAEHVELRAVEIDVQGLVASCLDQIRPAAAAKALALGTEVAPGTPRAVVGDPTRLRQVLLNLLGNAVKFTAQGQVAVRLRPADDASSLRIEVVDTGPGIQPEQRQNLFQEFERLHDGAADLVEGAGLGLALSARLASLMGGRIGHDDNPVGGSVFWLQLPIAGAGAATVQAPAPELPDASPVPEPGRALHVLVVDDLAMNRDIARSFLLVAGHDVTCVEGGAEAVAAVAAGDFDVVLMDIRMPGVDGLEATRQIRKLGDQRAKVPIVGLTAQAFAEQVEECHRAGMDGHLAKPYGPAALVAAVARAVRGAADPQVATMGVRRPNHPPERELAGVELPILDREAVGNLMGFMPGETIASYLESIASRGQAILLVLDRNSAPAGGADRVPRGGELVDAVHSLAGSAGMFGFQRLAQVGRRFEQAVRAGTDEAPALTEALRAAIVASLQEIDRQRLQQAA